MRGNRAPDAGIGHRRTAGTGTPPANAVGPSAVPALLDAGTADPDRARVGRSPQTVRWLQRTLGNTATTGLVRSTGGGTSAGPLSIQRAIPSTFDWLRTTFHKGNRSAGMKAIDQALRTYHSTSRTATDEEAVEMLAAIQDAIVAWERGKQEFTGDEVASGRADRVARLHNEVDRERVNRERTLRGQIPTGPDAGDRYGHVAAYAPGVLMDVTGGFRGTSAAEHHQAAATVAQPGSGARGTREVDIRIEMLAGKAREAYRQFRTLREEDPNASDALAVFTAPEWFFKRPSVPFTLADKEKIITAFMRVSAACPGMVMLPGSTVWRERHEDTLDIKAGTFAVLNGRLLHEIIKRREGSDTVGYAPDPEERQGLAPAAAQRAAQLGRDLQERFNDVGETETGSSFFDVGPLTVAVEICQDHNRKRAVTELQKMTDPLRGGAHVQILISHSSMATRSVLRPGGVLISNDSKDSDQFADTEGEVNRDVGAERSLRVADQEGNIRGTDTLKARRRTRDAQTLADMFLGIFTLPQPSLPASSGDAGGAGPAPAGPSGAPPDDLEIAPAPTR